MGHSASASSTKNLRFGGTLRFMSAEKMREEVEGMPCWLDWTEICACHNCRCVLTVDILDVELMPSFGGCYSATSIAQIPVPVPKSRTCCSGS